MNFLYSVNVDRNFKPLLNQIVQDSLVISQTYQGGSVAEVSKILLPGVSFFEKKASYINLEGKSQITSLAISPSKKARTDSYLLSLLLIHLYRNGFLMESIINFWFKKNLYVSKNNRKESFTSIQKPGKFKNFRSIFDFPIKNFYKTDNLSEMSIIMSKLSSRYNNFSNFKI